MGGGLLVDMELTCGGAEEDGGSVEDCELHIACAAAPTSSSEPTAVVEALLVRGLRLPAPSTGTAAGEAPRRPHAALSGVRGRAEHGALSAVAHGVLVSRMAAPLGPGVEWRLRIAGGLPEK